MEKRRDNGGQPPGLQSGQEQGGVADAGGHAQQLPAAATSKPSAASSRPTARREKPTRQQDADFRRPPLDPKRNSSATSITAARMRKELNARKRTPKGVVPAAAASPWRFTGWKMKASAAGGGRKGEGGRD